MLRSPSLRSTPRKPNNPPSETRAKLIICWRCSVRNSISRIRARKSSRIQSSVFTLCYPPMQRKAAPASSLHNHPCSRQHRSQLTRGLKTTIKEPRNSEGTSRDATIIPHRATWDRISVTRIQMMDSSAMRIYSLLPPKGIGVMVD